VGSITTSGEGEETLLDLRKSMLSSSSMLMRGLKQGGEGRSDLSQHNNGKRSGAPQPGHARKKKEEGPARRPSRDQAFLARCGQNVGGE